MSNERKRSTFEEKLFLKRKLELAKKKSQWSKKWKIGDSAILLKKMNRREYQKKIFEDSNIESQWYFLYIYMDNAIPMYGLES